MLSQRGVSSGPQSLKEVDFAGLEDGSLIDLVKDPEKPDRALLAVWRNGEVRYVDKLEYKDQVLVPVPPTNPVLRHVRLPRGVRRYGSVPSLLQEIESFISGSLVLQPNQLELLANFVLATWLVDCLPVAPYVLVVGLPQSGKTTLLEVLGFLCRRSVLTADISSAAFYQACTLLTPTLLIDEAGAPTNLNSLRHLLRSGTTRSLLALRKNEILHAYGAKVLSWPELPDDAALNSRCILIPMVESNRIDLIRTNDPDLEKRANELQNSLLQFRFENYGNVQLPNTPGAEKLGPRARDLFLSVAAPSSQDPERCRLLLDHFEFQYRMSREPLPFAQHAVLCTLFDLIHPCSEGCLLLIRDLTSAVNSVLRDHREGLRLQPRKVGSALTSLGFWRRERSNQGWKVQLTEDDRKRIHTLVKTYGTDELPPWVSTWGCRICDELGLVKRPAEIPADFDEAMKALGLVKVDPNPKKAVESTGSSKAGRSENNQKV